MLEVAHRQPGAVPFEPELACLQGLAVGAPEYGHQDAVPRPGPGSWATVGAATVRVMAVGAHSMSKWSANQLAGPCSNTSHHQRLSSVPIAMWFGTRSST